jgi:hypothetical protein
MSRGQQAQVQKEGTAMLGNENANANSAFNTVMPGYESILSNPGYTGAQKDAITNATEGGIGAAFGAANQSATNTAARTGNAAGLTSQQDALARQRMITSGNAASQNQTNFANDAQKQQMQALGGIGQLYGENLGGANSTLGTLGKNAETPGFWDQMANSLVSAGGQVGAAALG